jgi:hypothetical protein
VRLRAMNLVRALQITGLDGQLERIAVDQLSPGELRTTALAILVRRRPGIDDMVLKFLLGRLSATTMQRRAWRRRCWEALT